MTGGGASSVAFVKEDEFDSVPADPTYYLPGRNPVINDLSLQNTLQRLREPDTAEAVDSLANRLEGAFGITYVMSNDVHGDIRDIVFNDDGDGFETGHAPTSSWYLGVEYLDSISTTATAERHLKACIPLEYSIAYNEGEPIRETLTMGYADEEKNTTLTPDTITGPDDGGDVPFHGADLQVDGATVAKLQTATLQFANLYRFHRGASRTPVDAVLAAPEATLEASAIYGQDDYLELAYGASGDSSPQDQLSSVSGSLAFDVDGSTVATYTLPKLKPDTYQWSDLIAAETDLTDPVTYHVNGGISIS